MELKQQYIQQGTNYFVSHKGNQKENGLKLVHSLDYKRVNDFIKGVKEDDYQFYDDYPGCKEVVLIGNANSGKSSLINALNNDTKIAYTAKRSGKTQELNFYLVQHSINKRKKGMIVDTPGYGYVFAPVHLKEKWRKMVFKYLGFGVRINMILFCVNANLGLKQNDFKMLDDLSHFNKPTQVVLTKLDKLRNQKKIIMSQQAEIKKQIEYYLSDKNLSNDKFFHDKIASNAEGWLDIADILNCNKIKKMKITTEDIASSVKDSTEVEVSADGKQVRRAGAKALPELAKKGEDGQRKRDQKAAGKKANEEEKGDDNDEPLQLDERGNPILVNADFENPIIVHFKTEGKDGDSFKVNWKEIENEVRQKFPHLKIVYSRADQFQGDLAISSHKLKQANLEKLTSSTLKVQDRQFTFSKTAGEELKDFWQKQGGHYQFCIQPKLRNIKKQQKAARMAQRESGSSGAGNKRAKLSYEIAGVYYTDISKVKSKARAILNLKKDGEKLTGNDEEFIKELIKCHDKADDKMKEFDHFEAGEHPSFEKTRCFFIVRKDGSKEDFSISKCIFNLEKQSA